MLVEHPIRDIAFGLIPTIVSIILFVVGINKFKKKRLLSIFLIILGLAGALWFGAGTIALLIWHGYIS